MNVGQEIKDLWAKVSRDEGDSMVTMQDFVEEQNSIAVATPKEIVDAVTCLKNEALKLGETALGLKYYTEAKLMESTVMPLVNETVATEIEEGMIGIQRKAVTLAGAAMKNLVTKRNKQLEELQVVNKTLDKVTGGLKAMKRLFKKIGGEQGKLFDIVGAVSFSSGPKVDRDILETAAEEWKKELAKFNQGSQGTQVKSG